MKYFAAGWRWILIFSMFVISAVSYLDRVNISIAGPLDRAGFHLDHIQMGWVFQRLVLGYACFKAPAAAWPTGSVREEL